MTESGIQRENTEKLNQHDIDKWLELHKNQSKFQKWLLRSVFPAVLERKSPKKLSLVQISPNNVLIVFTSTLQSLFRHLYTYSSFSSLVLLGYVRNRTTPLHLLFWVHKKDANSVITQYTTSTWMVHSEQSENQLYDTGEYTQLVFGRFLSK